MQILNYIILTKKQYSKITKKLDDFESDKLVRDIFHQEQKNNAEKHDKYKTKEAKEERFLEKQLEIEKLKYENNAYWSMLNKLGVNIRDVISEYTESMKEVTKQSK